MDYSSNDDQYDDQYSSSSENDSKTTETKKMTHKKRKRVPENIPDENLFVTALNCKIKDIRPTETKDRKVFETSDPEIEQYCLYWNYHGDKKDREIVKKIARKVNNRISASKSRKSKSDQLEQLKEQIRILEQENENYKSQIRQEKLKNDNLTEQIDKLRSIFQNIPQHQVNSVIGLEYHFNFEEFLSQELYPKKIHDEELSLHSNDESNESTNEYNCISPIGQDADYFEGLMYNNEICEKEIPVLDEDNFNFIDGSLFDDNKGIFESEDRSYFPFFSKVLLILLGLSILLIPSSGSQIIQLSTYGSKLNFFGDMSNTVISFGVLAIFFYECFKIWK